MPTRRSTSTTRSKSGPDTIKLFMQDREEGPNPRSPDDIRGKGEGRTA
jgi:hypothetical protein